MQKGQTTMVSKKDNKNAGMTSDDFDNPQDEVGSVAAAAVDNINDEWGSVPDDWEEESTGFPPYWNPGEGKSFRARFLLVDARDPDFVRFVCENTGKTPLICWRGPAEDAEPVEVPPGGQFTISEYAGLPLVFLLGEEALIRADHKQKTSKPGQSVWIWKMKLPPVTAQLLRKRRSEAALKAASNARQMAGRDARAEADAKPVAAEEAIS